MTLKAAFLIKMRQPWDMQRQKEIANSSVVSIALALSLFFFSSSFYCELKKT